MKELMGMFGVVSLAIGILLSTNNIKIGNQMNIATLITLNSANSENEDTVYGATAKTVRCTYYYPDGSFTSSVKDVCEPNYIMVTYCTPTECGG